MTQYQPSVSNLREALLRKWYLIQNLKIPRQILKEPQSFHTKKGKSLKDLLVRAKLTKTKQEAGNDRVAACHFLCFSSYRMLRASHILPLLQERITAICDV